MTGKRHKTAIALGIFFLVVLPLSTVGIVVLLGQINEKVQKVQEETVRVEGRTQRLSRLSEFRAQYEEIHAKESDLQILVREEDVVALIQRMETIAQETGVKISIAVVNTGEESKKKKDKSTEKKNEHVVALLPTTDAFLALRITLTCTFADGVRFVRRMETMDYAGDIMRLLIVKKEEDEQKNRERGIIAVLSSPNEKSSALTETEQDIAHPVEMQLDMVFYFEDEQK